jgi:ribosomal protein S18 acetylase RimI-like enzyme
MKIIQYETKFRDKIIDALVELQKHESSLSDTRKIASREMCANYFKEMAKGKILLATLQNAFAGFIAYNFQHHEVIYETEDSNNYALISEVYVDETYRRLGVAHLLIESVFNDLKQQGYKGRVRICSLSNNDMAVNAYKKYGFMPYEITFEKKI